MIKRLIFDIDNTLIIWKKDYIKALEKAMREFNVNIDSKIIDKIIDSQEMKYDTLSKEKLLNDINDECSLNLNMDFIDKLFQEQKTLAKPDQEIIDTLKYLSSKYELVILTNYFTEVQTARLKKAQILRYFKEIYGGDQILLKPRKEAFSTAVANFKKEECIMIGDSLAIDIEGAINYGIKAIAFDYKSEIPNSNKYQKINKICELKEIL